MHKLAKIDKNHPHKVYFSRCFYIRTSLALEHILRISIICIPSLINNP